MSSWNGASEEALATVVCERLGQHAPKLLIGGLGMGFTLRAALANLPANARIVVAELVPGILAWADGLLAHLFRGALADPRVSVELRDVHDIIERRPGEFDAILLDVDNGPDGLVALANERLYCDWGLRATCAALKPGGLLAILSADRDHALVERLRHVGFSVEEVAVSTGSDEQSCLHYIWLATTLA